jgi:nitric oxide synthase-interacting protein
MGRKSKHAGSGHLPLTNYERKEIGKDYGTTTARLGSASQTPFGHCVLSLHPANEHPVATPSGYIYDRHAMLQYLLHQTQELKKAQQRYEQWLKDKESQKSDQEDMKRKAQLEKFEDTQKVVAKRQKLQDANPLARSSFWLADFQPEKLAELPDHMEPPPTRPSSPMTQKPLRRKDLIPLELKRNLDGQVVCAISDKAIVAQSAIALITTGLERPSQVVLEQIFNDLGDKKVCPITGRKISKILKLRSGGSSFAASGSIEAQSYRPGMT